MKQVKQNIFKRTILLKFIRFTIQLEKKVFGNIMSFRGCGRNRMVTQHLYFNNHPYERNGCE